MTFRAVIVFALVAAIVVPVLISEFRRLRPRAVARPAPARAPKRVAEAKPRLRLVVNKNDMDRELAALLAQNNRKPTERDE